jgi:predicted ArsR family transcriptional regulator
MSKASSARWSRVTTRDAMERRAAGRGHYHHQRRTEVMLRRIRIMELLNSLRINRYDPGTVSLIAEKLGISKATASRDLQALKTGDDGPRKRSPGELRDTDDEDED